MDARLNHSTGARLACPLAGAGATGGFCRYPVAHRPGPPARSGRSDSKRFAAWDVARGQRPRWVQVGSGDQAPATDQAMDRLRCAPTWTPAPNRSPWSRRPVRRTSAAVRRADEIVVPEPPWPSPQRRRPRFCTRLWALRLALEPDPSCPEEVTSCPRRWPSSRQ